MGEVETLTVIHLRAGGVAGGSAATVYPTADLLCFIFFNGAGVGFLLSDTDGG